MRKSLIDDVRLEDEEKGPAIMFPNPEIRRMMHLAGVDKNDIFFDLGCGWGQNLIIALTEFHVRKAVGLENDSPRHEVAKERIEKLGLKKRCNILNEDLNKLLRGKLKDANLEEATVVFYGLSTSLSVLDKLRKQISPECRLIYYYNCLFPEIMPDVVEYPFLVSKAPFKKSSSDRAWLIKVTNKNESSIRKGHKPSVSELWDELRHDHDLVSNIDEIANYRKRLAMVLDRRKMTSRSKNR